MPTEACKLRALGAPARYGLGEQTLTDLSVRDTCEVPKEQVDVRKIRISTSLAVESRAVGLAQANKRLTAR